jgi:hypothetical protein
VIARVGPNSLLSRFEPIEKIIMPDPSAPVDLLHPRQTRTKVASMSLKEVPSDHDFFDPAYVKQWTDSIIRYRPERQ